MVRDLSSSLRRRGSPTPRVPHSQTYSAVMALTPLCPPRGEKVVTSALMGHSTLNAASTFRSFLPAACVHGFLPSFLPSFLFRHVVFAELTHPCLLFPIPYCRSCIHPILAAACLSLPFFLPPPTSALSRIRRCIPTWRPYLPDNTVITIRAFE